LIIFRDHAHRSLDGRSKDEGFSPQHLARDRSKAEDGQEKSFLFRAEWRSQGKKVLIARCSQAKEA
jgi:hypothetical protein